jgi:sulfur-oxidizing protein SoxX
VARLRTSGDLLTSIIHPTAVSAEKMPRPGSQRVTESPMPVVNDDTTVTQMIDLVTFLQPRFTQIPPPPTWSQLP